jgi:hypothetical protein
LRATVAQPAVYGDSWKALFASIAALFRPRPSITRIVVSAMSEEWLKQYEASKPKQCNE